MWTEAGIEEEERRQEFPIYFEPIETMQDSAVSVDQGVIILNRYNTVEC